jgi:2,3-bisphosphoglycerate-independent phosphoglycerate mutase
MVKAHGTVVGLPSDDDMGNSEVGHNALGAGCIFAKGMLLLSVYFRDMISILYHSVDT